jgi:glycerol-3-phosphate O-acyltransferase/dihydroxyacetone phosphate acyltransferase
MFYRACRAIVSWGLHLFFTVEPTVDPHRALSLDGPVLLVGNHPNGLIDPAVLFALSPRAITFLAKEPLFRLPILGFILKSLGALPVFRKQDTGGDTSKNESTLAASVEALVAGKALTIFPEGKSHSEPQLADLKTGAARIALEAVRRGALVRLVPVGMTYDAKSQFRSRVHVEVGAPVEAKAFLEQEGEPPHHAAVRLTDAVAQSLRQVTLNVDAWADIPVLDTAETLYALSVGDPGVSAERRKAFARGMALLRAENPARLQHLKMSLAAFRRRLDVLTISPSDLSSQYRPLTVTWFVLRNLMWLLALPLWLLGMALFVLPYYFPLLCVRLVKPDDDTESTVKFLASLLIAPLWWAFLTAVAGWWVGLPGGVGAFFSVPPLALFTRVWWEGRSTALRDIRTFFVLTRRKEMVASLVAEGTALTTHIEGVVAELKPRLM